MSEKRYVIVSPSHHKKPRAMFLSKPADGSKHPQWNYHTTFALLLTKSQIGRICADVLVSFVPIEYNDDIKELARTGETKFIDYVNKVEEVRNTSRVFDVDGLKKMIQHTMSSVRKETPKTQAQETSEPQEKNVAKFVVYCRLADGSMSYCHDANTEKNHVQIKGKNATLYDIDKANEIAERMGKGFYFVSEFKSVFSLEDGTKQPTPAPEAKKPIGYLLERDTYIDKPYFCPDARCENVIERDGVSVQVFQTAEYAQWVADLQYIETGIVWQVKPV